MIELNDKTRQDFLDRKWVQKLLDAGVDMSDAKYSIATRLDDSKDYVFSMSSFKKMDVFMTLKWINIFPTYTVSELLYKLWEYDSKYGSLKGGPYFIKDAPFYCFWYENEESKVTLESCFEYPIESLANLLIQCHKKGIGDVGNISDK